MRRSILLLPFVFGCAQQDRAVPTADSAAVVTTAPTCAGGGGALDGRSVGTLRLGMSADSALAVCPSAHDTVEYQEGESLRVLVATIDGDTIRVRIAENTVHSIFVQSPLFATADSLKAGMSVARLLALPQLAGGFGEGAYYVWSDDEPWCGLSFLLDEVSARAQVGSGSLTRSWLESVADSGRVTAILVRGCTR